MSESLRVYVKPGCPWCLEAEAWLKREGYVYEAVDVYADPSAYEEMQRLSGQSCAPTLTYGDLLLADFGVPELEAFLEEHGIAP
ncbi:MAG: glutaredoxin family protein [Verrucomicrobiae bacterium]|nr:glutaredoxin family protein [Verrucomicrobiae bacterium]MCP5539312.1 glutaredoxin family protein [Akkermansiaceae bacterium]